MSHAEVNRSHAASPDAYRVIRPDYVPFVSYPYEWGFQMLKDAALATLRIQELALDHGMSLRDATAYNLTFHRGRPLFLDTTSFEILPEGRPWIAYRQFCQHFVAPLALMSLRDPRLGKLSRLFIDGVPLDLASELLPPRARTKAGVVMHLRITPRASDATRGTRTQPGRNASFSENALRGLIASLRKTIERLDGRKGDSHGATTTLRPTTIRRMRPNRRHRS